MLERGNWGRGFLAAWALIGAAAFADSPAPTGVEGLWAGAIEAGGGVKLRIALEIAKKPDGALTATATSIDQGNTKLPAEAVTFADHQLHVGLGVAEYDGKLDDTGTALTGSWKQHGNAIPLNFTRAASIPVVSRPQEPKKPYPYREEEVGYESTAAGVHLGGTLTLPNGSGPFPAVLLITGSGQQNRDEALLGHKPFLVLADYLTRRGVAVLRVDDRGIGASTGDFAKSTSADFAADVKAGVRFLKGRHDIQARHIGLVGHSEGGLIAPMVAAEVPDVAFIVMMAGPGVTGEEILLEQGALIARAGGISEQEVALDKETKKKMFAVLREEKDPAKAQERLMKIGRESIAKMPPSKRRDEETKQLASGVNRLNEPWMRYFLSYDPVTALKHVRCPVLALNGELDLQVPPKQNLPAIEASLKAGGNQDYTVRELPHLNHLFQAAKTGSPAEYAQIEETINPAALELMGTWISAHTGAAPR